MDKDYVRSLFDSSQSARSLQKAVGPSGLGGCQRRLWHQLHGTPRLQETDTFAATVGTWVHKGIEERVRATDSEGRYLLEMRVEHDGIGGTVDCYDTVDKEVVDWKTTKKSSLRYFPGDGYWTQIQTYGWLLEHNGYAVETVTVVGIIKDEANTTTGLAFHSQPYDPSVAPEALQRMRDLADTPFPPEPEKHVSFCVAYCNFYDVTGEVGCTGKLKR